MKNLQLLILILFAFSCRDKYIPEQVAPASGYLVVEGNINNGNSPTTLILSRTNTLSETSRITEPGAKVLIEGSDNSIFNLPETVSGNYTISNLNLDVTKTYRLHITTRAGKEYLSSYVAVKPTPAIDSISWIQETGGVRLYINAHDDAAQTKYYQWNYQETWEIHSPYLSVLDYNDTDPRHPFLRFIDSTTFSAVKDIQVCWISRNSTSLLLGSTAKLSRDRVYLPVNFIPNGVRELSVLYSINVNQYALSKEAYEYLEKMRKNTESTGSIFDPQPSSLRGNIYSAGDENETVIGYVNISSVEEKRIFIKNLDLNDWHFISGCEEYELPNNPDSILMSYEQGLSPTTVATSRGPNILSIYVTNDKACIDCTLLGTNVKPSFWP
jgi:hypothetical protein